MTNSNHDSYRNGRKSPVGWPVSRRGVLKSGAVASGTLVLGGSALAGSTAARSQGGSGFITAGDLETAVEGGLAFKVLAADGSILAHPAGCGGKGNAPDKEYEGYPIQFAGGAGEAMGHLFVEPKRRFETGVWQEVTTARVCPPAGKVRPPSGSSLESEVHRVAFRAAGLSPGVPVVDIEDADPDPAVVLAVLDVPISDWVVYGTETVAYQNLAYDADERVVIVSFEHLLDSEWPAWVDADPDTLFDEVVSRGIKFHAFPLSRLDRV